MATQFPHSMTVDGLEATYQVNYLGHFHLTRRLLPLLRRTRAVAGVPPRIVHLSSGAHRAGTEYHAGQAK